MRRSASISSVFAPCMARSSAKLIATVDLPSPGRVEIMPMTLAPPTLTPRSTAILVLRSVSANIDSG
ncbi:hypothetical protein D3C72_2025640 [compost metagenome]